MSIKSQFHGHFDELLDDDDLVRESVEMLESSLEKARLIFGGRRLAPYLRPHFVTRKEWEFVSSRCELVFGVLQKVNDAALNDQRILEELGVTDAEKTLIAPDPGYSHAAPMARLDSFLCDDDFNYVELNGESPAGIAFSDSARDIFLELPIIKRVTDKYQVETLEGRRRLLESLMICYREYAGSDAIEKPTIAIVDLKDLPTVQEFELCKEYFEAHGHKSIICSPEDLEYDGKVLTGRGVPIDVVYRRLLVREYTPIMDQFPELFDAYRDGNICLANSYRSLLLHKKAMFAVMTDEAFGELFTTAEQEVINSHVPWTRVFRERKTKYFESDIDLVEWTRSNRDQLVLKPNDDYGGKGIYIGWTSDEHEWDSAIEAALEHGDYLVQRKVAISREVFPYIHDDGTVEKIDSMVDLDPLMFAGKTGSAFTRLSTTELANVSSGGGMVPTMILEGEK